MSSITGRAKSLFQTPATPESPGKWQDCRVTCSTIEVGDQVLFTGTEHSSLLTCAIAAIFLRSLQDIKTQYQKQHQTELPPIKVNDLTITLSESRFSTDPSTDSVHKCNNSLELGTAANIVKVAANKVSWQQD